MRRRRAPDRVGAGTVGIRAVASAARLGLPVAALLGCAAQAPAPPPAVGLANPAAVFCVRRGGTHVIRDTPAGQVGYCVFPDGREVEAWAYFRAEAPRPR
jgi:putative hemolysin